MMNNPPVYSRLSRRRPSILTALITLALVACSSDETGPATDGSTAKPPADAGVVEATDIEASTGETSLADSTAPQSDSSVEAVSSDGATDGSLRDSLSSDISVSAEANSEAADGAAKKRPNVLLIVADDLGYSDIGAFGGEIVTPNLDALATEGRVLTDHHAAPTCSPTRSMLFSGTDHHLAGLGTMAEVLQDNQKGKPGYEGYLNDRSLSIAELLHDSGYHTYMAGKWHLGADDLHSPKARGFDSSFVLLGGAASHFAPVIGKPTPADQVTYREDGLITQVPEYFYSSNFYTDKLISYIRAHAHDGTPFFAYAAFTAPHWPLQVPSDDIDRYKGKYDEGYAVVRARRVAKQKLLGIIPADLEVNPGLPGSVNTPIWDQLTDDQKKVEARKMEIYAAMVENLDRNIGRLVQYLKDIGEWDNTFVFFQSDNGAEGSASFPDGPNTDNALANLGHPLSNVYYGHRWAEVSATPFHLWKGFSSEGGVVVPAIARLPGQIQKRAAFTQFSHVSDLAPTFLELAGAPNPGTHYRDHDVNPITGSSLLPVLTDQSTTLRPAGTVLADELFGRRYVRRDDWKATYIEAPWGTGAWALYNLQSDRAEAHDLSATQPTLVNDLATQWDTYATRVGIVLPLTSGMGAREGLP